MSETTHPNLDAEDHQGWDAPGLAERFAGLVADGPGALMLAQDNTVVGRGAHAQLAGGEVPFLVRPRPDVFCLDVDLDGTATDTTRLEAVESLRDHLGNDAVCCASGRAGNLHLFVVLDADPSARSMLCAHLAGCGVDVRDHGIRPPLAPHRRTGHSQPLGTTPDEALRALSTPAPLGRTRDLLAALGLPRVPDSVVSLARSAHPERYPSASEARMALACAVANAGLPRGYLEALLCDPTNAVSERFSSRPPRWQTAEIERLWSRATQRIAEHTGPARWAAELDAWRRSLRRSTWQGTAGATDLALAEAFAERLSKRGRTRCSFATSSLALAAGVSLPTARRGLRRLLATGWLVRLAPAGPTRAALYQLAVPAHVPTTTEPTTTAGGLGSDLARWGALGKSAYRVLRELGDAPLSTTELAARLGVRRATVARHLARLCALNLARRLPDGVVRGPAAEDEVAEQLGSLGAAAVQEREFAELRARRREVLAQLTAHRSKLRSAAAGRGAHPPP